MKIRLALTALRTFCRIMRVATPDFHPQATDSFKMRILLTRATLSTNGYNPCVLGDGSRGWQKDGGKGTAKWALEQIHAGMPQEI